VRNVLFGIHWDCIPEKNFISEVRKLNKEGRVIIPDGLKRVVEYFWGSKSLQVVEADSMATVMRFAEQFSPYVRSFEVTALITGKELVSAVS
jgi:hypothetical protein